MLAYNLDNKFINPDDLMKHMLGAQVLVYFNLRHYTIGGRNADDIRGNTFSAYATQVQIIRKAETLKSPYKSKVLRGPFTLPQSPTKFTKQSITATALHSPSVKILSKAEGKKRQMDEGDEDIIEAGEIERNDVEKKEMVAGKKKKKT